MGSNERLILADFGLGKESIASEMKTTLGTRLYAGQSTDPTYTDPSPETCTISFDLMTAESVNDKLAGEVVPLEDKCGLRVSLGGL